MNNIKLPDHPGRLILLALDDLEKCERSDKYQINMMTFHIPNIDSGCYVCLAGAILAQTGQVPSSKFTHPGMFNESKKLHALSTMALGCVADGIDDLGYSCPQELLDATIPQYHEDRAAFKAALRHVAEVLLECFPSEQSERPVAVDRSRMAGLASIPPCVNIAVAPAK